MKKKVYFIPMFLCATIGGVYYSSSTQCPSELMLANVEALANSEKAEATCEGNTSICAKGVDENTGHEFHIHGVLTFQ